MLIFSDETRVGPGWSPMPSSVRSARSLILPAMCVIADVTVSFRTVTPGAQVPLAGVVHAARAGRGGLDVHGVPTCEKMCSTGASTRRRPERRNLGPRLVEE